MAAVADASCGCCSSVVAAAVAAAAVTAAAAAAAGRRCRPPLGPLRMRSADMETVSGLHCACQLTAFFQLEIGRIH